MKNFIYLFLAATLFLVLFCSPHLAANKRVANYSFGKYGTKTYETLSFWIDAGKRGQITYSYGKTDREITLSYIGPDIFNGESCFKVQFANGLILYIIPKGLSLKIVDSEGKYSKLFRWKYEGPIDGRGTFCDVCAEDKESMMIIRKFFLK
jgi:hypothetical protein